MNATMFREIDRHVVNHIFVRMAERQWKGAGNLNLERWEERKERTCLLLALFRESSSSHLLVAVLSASQADVLASRGTLPPRDILKF